MPNLFNDFFFIKTRASSNFYKLNPKFSVEILLIDFGKKNLMLLDC